MVNQANAFCRAAFDREASAEGCEGSMQCINCTNNLYYRCASKQQAVSTCIQNVTADIFATK